MLAGVHQGNSASALSCVPTVRENRNYGMRYRNSCDLPFQGRSEFGASSSRFL